jgi:hypothetical protein
MYCTSGVWGERVFLGCEHDIPAGCIYSSLLLPGFQVLTHLFEKRVYEYMLCRAFLKKIPHWQGPFLFGVGRLTFDAFN